MEVQSQSQTYLFVPLYVLNEEHGKKVPVTMDNNNKHGEAEEDFYHKGTKEVALLLTAVVMRS